MSWCKLTWHTPVQELENNHEQSWRNIGRWSQVSTGPWTIFTNCSTLVIAYCNCERNMDYPSLIALIWIYLPMYSLLEGIQQIVDIWFKGHKGPDKSADCLLGYINFITALCCEKRQIGLQMIWAPCKQLRHDLIGIPELDRTISKSFRCLNSL